MIADIMSRGNGVAQLTITEVKSGDAVLSRQQAAAIADTLKTGDVYISNEANAKALGIEPNVTFREQRILPMVSIVGGNQEAIKRQLMNEGIDIGGRGSRLRLGAPPN